MKCGSRERNGISFRCITDRGEELNVRIDVCSDTVLRFRMSLEEDNSGEKSPMETEKIWPEVDFEVIENDRQVKIKTSSLVVKITKDPWEFLIYNSMGHLVCGESHSDLDVQQKLKIKTLSYYKDETGIERVVGSFRVAPDERFDGF
ncbi:hypothetical protein HKBW3S47_02375 [Candidatus Hakubella thermalkaliphila]|uniref:Glycoside hydrolase family 31 N-terminal domain-containing protein n=1 Tax=Candidatus Hakubella thermalkaliphila TaxID=2754717 RepID=A0A6V8Q7I3_9ACTN|nr:DUF4968 domain-containing protein [Candidatus Hakubella thermalkaliphila]GFP40678.1 hypothetical protein HKBW3S47_02375 [Candidatus Hakubella thermalkaliphila]